MENLTPGTLLTAVLAFASGFVLLSNAVEKLVKAYKAAKAPNVHQDKRLDALEEWSREVDKKLLNDMRHLSAVDEGARVTQRALIALLEHGINGNNIKQMQDAKDELQNHLINR